MTAKVKNVGKMTHTDLILYAQGLKICIYLEFMTVVVLMVERILAANLYRGF